MKNLWEYTDGLFQSKEPIFVACVGGQYDVWYDVNDQAPSAKQIAAWEQFCSLEPCNLRKQFIQALDCFADKMNALPKGEIPKFGPSYYPIAMKKIANETAIFLCGTNQLLGEINHSVFMCDSLVIPLQEQAPCHFILMNFEVKIGRAHV